MSYDCLLNQTCTIQNRTTSFSNSGASTTTFANLATGVKCTIQPNTGRQRSQTQSEENNVTHLAFFKQSQAIVNGDKVIDANSAEYMVVRVFNAAGRTHHKEVELELLDKS
jgi:hypothetical protein